MQSVKVFWKLGVLLKLVERITGNKRDIVSSGRSLAAIMKMSEHFKVETVVHKSWKRQQKFFPSLKFLIQLSRQVLGRTFSTTIHFSRKEQVLRSYVSPVNSCTETQYQISH